MANEMKPYLAADLGAVFTYDFPIVVKYRGKKYTALSNDTLTAETDELGGPIAIDQNEYHFQTSDLLSVVNGEEINVLGRNAIIVSNTLSADGSELIIRVRAA